MKLDRLFRGASDALNHVEKWGKAKTALHVLDMGGSAVDTASAMGKMFFTMTAAFAEMEKNPTGERTKDALAQLRDEGKVYCHITPLGFNRKGDRLVANRREQAMVRKIRAMQAKGLSLGKIAAALNHAKVPTKRGGEWYA